MRQTWAYVVMAVGTLLGIGALLIPLPETFNVEAPKPVVESKVESKRPTPAPKANKKGPGKAPAKASPPSPKKLPTKNTVKGRITPTRK